MDRDPQDIPGVVAHPPLLYAGGLLLGLVLYHFLPQAILPDRFARALGILCVLASVVGFAGLWAFLRAGTSPDPFVPSGTLVVSGPYRWTRNPMYLGFTLLYLGISLWVNALWPLLLLVVLFAIQRGVIAREEAYLERRFGDGYRAYRTKVRRWL